MTERELTAAGLTPHGDGSLISPARLVLMPAGDFYRMTVELPGGAALTCVVARVALKVQHGGEKP